MDIINSLNVAYIGTNLPSTSANHITNQRQSLNSINHEINSEEVTICIDGACKEMKGAMDEVILHHNNALICQSIDIGPCPNSS